VLADDQLSFETYTDLAEATMVSLTLFNRKRSGEVQRIKFADYEKGRDSALSLSEDVVDYIDTIKKPLLSNLCRIEIMGKRGRGVPVLLRVINSDAIEQLLRNLNTVDVLPQSEFFFARVGFHLINLWVLH